MIVQACLSCLFIASSWMVPVFSLVDTMSSYWNKVIITIRIVSEVSIVSNNSRACWYIVRNTSSREEEFIKLLIFFFCHGWCFWVIDLLAWLMFWQDWCFVLLDVRAWSMFWHGRCLRFLRKYRSLTLQDQCM